MLRILALLVCLLMPQALIPQALAASAERISEIVAYDNVRIDVIAEGSGPPVMLLPGRGRDSLDFDDLAAGIAKAGFRVLRPQPRGAGESTGPMQSLTLHDFARDIAATSATKATGPPSLSDLPMAAGLRA